MSELSRNTFTAKNLNVAKDIIVDEKYDVKEGQRYVLHFKVKGSKKPGFFYQFQDILQAPFGFSNYRAANQTQPSGNISCALNVPRKSADFQKLQDLLKVVRNHFDENLELTKKIFDEEGQISEKDWKKATKKALIKEGKDADYDPFISLQVPFGFKKGEHKPTSGVDNREKIPYFSLYDLFGNKIEGITIENSESIVGKRSQLAYVVAKFDRITIKNSVLTIAGELYSAHNLVNTPLDSHIFITNEETEQKMMELRKQLENTSNNDHKPTTTTNNSTKPFPDAKKPSSAHEADNELPIDNDEVVEEDSEEGEDEDEEDEDA